MDGLHIGLIDPVSAATATGASASRKQQRTPLAYSAIILTRQFHHYWWLPAEKGQERDMWAYLYIRRQAQRLQRTRTTPLLHSMQKLSYYHSALVL